MNEHPVNWQIVRLVQQKAIDKGFEPPIDNNLFQKIDALVKAADKTSRILIADHGHRVAYVNFGELFEALKAIGIPAREYSGDSAAKTDE